MYNSMITRVFKGAPKGNKNAAGPHKPFTHGGADDDELVSVTTAPIKGNTSGKGYKIPPPPAGLKSNTGGGSHGTHSEAMQSAHDYIKSKGYEISDDNWQQHVAGTRKPGEGATNSYNIPMHKDGQETDKYAHIQVYNKGYNSTAPYELNTYIDSGKPKMAKAETGFSGLFKGAPMGNDNAADGHVPASSSQRLASATPVSTSGGLSTSSTPNEKKKKKTTGSSQSLAGGIPVDKPSASSNSLSARQ